MMKQKKRPVTAGPTTQKHSDNTIISDSCELAKYLIPLNGKVPAISSGDTWKRRFGPEEFNGGNFGLRLGEEFDGRYLLAIDYDGPDHLADFLEELESMGINAPRIAVKTGGKHNGYHLYFATQKPVMGKYKGNYRGTTVELLGNGCYTVIPPSKVERHYQIATELKTGAPICYKVGSVETFLEELESVEILDSFQLAKIQELIQEKREKTPSNLYSSYLVSFDSKALISSDLKLWETLLSSSFENTYHEKLSLKDSKNFKCIFHKEKRASAGLHYSKDKYNYHDFHTGKSYDVVEVFHALKHQKEPAFLEAKNSKNWQNALLELFDWIDENDITTGFGEYFDSWRRDFRENVNLSGGGEFKNYILDTFDAILDIARTRINKGINELVLSKRFVAERVAWSGDEKHKAKVINRAMNFLVFAGVLRKGRDLSTPNGRTYIFSINFGIAPQRLAEAWAQLLEAGIATVNDFKKATVAEYFGEELANSIFRASAIENQKTGGMEDELRDGFNERFKDSQDNISRLETLRESKDMLYVTDGSELHPVELAGLARGLSSDGLRNIARNLRVELQLTDSVTVEAE